MVATVEFMSHEIKGPASSIQMMASALRDCLGALKPQEAQAMCEAIISKASYLSQLAEEMSGDGAGAVLPPQPCDVHEAVVEAMRRVRRHPDGRYAFIKLPDRNGCAPALAAPEQLQQVLYHLLLNAAQATQGRGAIQVRTHQDGDQVVTEVRDQGRGIPAHCLDSIWEAGFSLKGSTGMGLHLCKALVSGWGGRIWAESDPGTGSRFVIELVSARRPVDA